MLLPRSAPWFLAGAVLLLELAADLGCFWLARDRITTVKNAEHWFEGVRQTVVADTSWRTRPIRFPVAWLVPAVAVAMATAITGAIRYPDLPSHLAVALRMGQAGFRLRGTDRGQGPGAGTSRDDDRFWKGGLIYVNRSDPAIMVGSRFGVGFTFNFGNPTAWLVFGMIVAVPAGLAVLRAVAGL